MINYQTIAGTNKPVDGAVDKTIIAAQGIGKKLYLLRGFIAVTVAAVGGSGEVALEDGAGGTRLIELDADAVGFVSFDFGDEGIPLTANTILNATVDGAATTQASARVTAICKVVG